MHRAFQRPKAQRHAAVNSPATRRPSIGVSVSGKRRLAPMHAGVCRSLRSFR
jgi:hypothetical protein